MLYTLSMKHQYFAMFEGARLSPSLSLESCLSARNKVPESCAAVFFSHVQVIQVMLL